MKKILILTIISLIFQGCGPSKDELDLRENIESSVTKSQIQLEQDEKKLNNITIKIGVSCNFDRTIINKTIFTFDSDDEAQKAVDKICELTALKSNFEIKAADVPNACAVVKCDELGNCKRFILYNQEFMFLVNDISNTNFSKIAILAHEIAHHLNGHTLTNDGRNWEFELEADKFAGFVLGKLGASLEDVKNVFSILPLEGSVTHPPRGTRITAAINGWVKVNGATVANKTSTKAAVDINEETLSHVKKKKSKKKFNQEACECGENSLSFDEGQKYVRCILCQRKFEIQWSGYDDAFGNPNYYLIFIRDSQFTDFDRIMREYK